MSLGYIGPHWEGRLRVMSRACLNILMTFCPSAYPADQQREKDQQPPLDRLMNMLGKSLVLVDAPVGGFVKNGGDVRSSSCLLLE